MQSVINKLTIFGKKYFTDFVNRIIQTDNYKKYPPTTFSCEKVGSIIPVINVYTSNIYLKISSNLHYHTQ